MALSLFDPRVLLGLLVAFLLSNGAIGLLSYNRGRDDVKAAQTSQELQDAYDAIGKFQGTANAINQAATDFTNIDDSLNSTISRISREFRNGAQQNPLPADCHLDTFRMQSLSTAIAATNAAIAEAGRGLGPAVPASK